MDMESLIARNDFVKRTEVLGVYNINGAETVVSRAADADLVFDIAQGGSVLSFAVSRSQHRTDTPYGRGSHGTSAPAIKGEYIVDYSIQTCVDGIANRPHKVSIIGKEYDVWKGEPIPSYDVDLKKGIPSHEVDEIWIKLDRQDKDLAKAWRWYVPSAKQMAIAKNNVKKSSAFMSKLTFNVRLANFLHNGR